MRYIYILLFTVLGFGAHAQITFYISGLGNQGANIIDHFATTGDDRGGIAISQNYVYYSGDTSTGRFGTDLLSQDAAGVIRDAMVCNISGNGGIYSLYSGNAPMKFSGLNGGGVFTKLVKLDPMTLAATTTVIPLSSPINLNNFIGIFSGTGYCLIQDQNAVYKIDFATGIVTTLTTNYDDVAGERNLCENGASWGVAEYDGTDYSLAYVKNINTIESRYVSNSQLRQSFSFVNLGDMCSFVVSPWTNKWYFHYEGNAQFGGVTETMGAAELSYVGSVPLNVGFTELNAQQKSINTAKINWKVQKEDNVTAFEIEKMNSQNEFFKIGSVKPNANFYYTFFDENATDSKNYYRIKVIEANGDTYYSAIVNTSNGYKPVQDITITPNPADEKINIFLGNDAGNSKLEIINNMGQVVFTQNGSKDYLSADISHLAKGYYHVRITGDNTLSTGKFIKK
jgi:hypothetical protein